LAGTYEPVLPLDSMILEQLPKQGALISNIYPDAISSRDIAKLVPGSDVSLISTRLRVLRIFGLVVTYKIPRSPTQGYQITPKGESLLVDLGVRGSSTEVSDGS